MVDFEQKRVNNIKIDVEHVSYVAILTPLAANSFCKLKKKESMQ